jgi:hypothetical protein
MSIKYNKIPEKRTSVYKICQHFPLQDPPKFTQILMFGLKTNHLATLLVTLLASQSLPLEIALRKSFQPGRLR